MLFVPAQATQSVWTLIIKADPVVQLVMLVLIGFSVASWAIIVQRYLILNRAMSQSVAFLDKFWATSSLEEAASTVKRFPDSPVAAAFAAGYKELVRLNEVETQVGQGPLGSGSANIARALRKAGGEAMTRLERSIPFLASCGSAAPFIGLFGTVWGILRAFQEIGARGTTSIAEVGPFIAEALIATAFGLVAAIPAVMFFNYFATRLKLLAAETNNFSSDFLNLVDRHERVRSAGRQV
ncbi:MAG: protein TolQ [Proteobacteria bacterium]|nr:protein TolQ [Pseudomonadota bacterium]